MHQRIKKIIPLISMLSIVFLCSYMETKADDLTQPSERVIVILSREIKLDRYSDIYSYLSSLSQNPYILGQEDSRIARIYFLAKDEFKPAEYAKALNR